MSKENAFWKKLNWRMKLNKDVDEESNDEQINGEMNEPLNEWVRNELIKKPSMNQRITKLKWTKRTIRPVYYLLKSCNIKYDPLKRKDITEDFTVEQ